MHAAVRAVLVVAALRLQPARLAGVLLRPIEVLGEAAAWAGGMRLVPVDGAAARVSLGGHIRRVSARAG